MLCGSLLHVFNSCPDRDKAGAKQVFFQNLFAHKPGLRKNPVRPDEMVPGFASSPPPLQSFPFTTSHAAQNVNNALPPPAPVPFPNPPSILRHTSVSQPPDMVPTAPLVTVDTATPSPAVASTATKRVRYFVSLAKSFSQHVHDKPPLPPMPISIDNGLPHITFSLGWTHDGAELCGLMDTCGALNTGYLPFHQWIMSTNPEVVAEYLEFNAANPFEPVKLGGAIRDPEGFALEHHGNLSAFGNSSTSVTASFFGYSTATVAAHQLTHSFNWKLCLSSACCCLLLLLFLAL
jgi:hypothetical protein